MPRDIDPRADRLDGVFLYNVDDLTAQVQESLSARSREAELAEAIVVNEALGYARWADAEQATPTIVALRARLRAALELELNRSLKGRLKHLSEEDRGALVKMVDASINRLLHGPTLRLRQSAAARSSGGVEGSPVEGMEALPLEQLTLALSELFDLSQGGAPPDDAEMDSLDEALPSASVNPPPPADDTEEPSPLPGKRAHSEAQ